MTIARDIDPLLLAAVSALLLVALYALWLWLRLWFIHNALTGILDPILPRNQRRNPGNGCVCSGLLFLLSVIVVGIALLAFTH